MFGRLAFILTIASLLCCVATGVCWVRSYWEAEMFVITWDRHDVAPVGEFPGYTKSRIGELVSAQGHVGIGTFYCDWYQRGIARKKITCAHLSFFHLDGPRQSQWGGVPNFSIEISYVIPTTGFAILPVIALLRRRLKKLHRSGFAALQKSAINSPA